jgi:poly(3-hydroxybutyrate) depolymerase
MKKVAFLTIALIALIGPCPRQTFAAPPDVIHDTITSGGRKRSYYLFVPDTVKAPAPLVVLLHGSGHNGRSLIDKWQDLAEKEGRTAPIFSTTWSRRSNRNIRSILGASICSDIQAAQFLGW